MFRKESEHSFIFRSENREENYINFQRVAQGRLRRMGNVLCQLTPYGTYVHTYIY